MKHTALLMALALASACARSPANEGRVSGYVEATEVRVAAEVGGRLLEVRVNEGDRVTAGDVQVHPLESVPTAGLTYDDRDRLSRAVYERMADGMRRLYGVESPPYVSIGAAAAREMASNPTPDVA